MNQIDMPMDSYPLLSSIMPMRHNAGTLSEVHANDDQRYHVERLILIIWNDLP